MVDFANGPGEGIVFISLFSVRGTDILTGIHKRQETNLSECVIMSELFP